MDSLLTMNIPLWVLLSYMVFMCAVQTMPRPSEQSNKLYIWAYGFLHLLCMNIALFLDPTKKLKTQAGNGSGNGGGNGSNSNAIAAGSGS